MMISTIMSVTRFLAGMKLTEVAYGIENTIKMTIKCFSIVTLKVDVCADYKGPSIFVKTPQILQAYDELKERGVKVRFITEIKKNNVDYCKRLCQIGELRHLEGVNGNFGVLDENDYYAPAISQDYNPVVPMMIHINIKDVVIQHQYLFDFLWDKAIPSSQKIKELEEEIYTPIIETIRDLDKIRKIESDLVKNAKNEILLLFPKSYLVVYKHSAGKENSNGNSNGEYHYNDTKNGNNIIHQISEAAINKNLKVQIISPISEGKELNLSTTIQLQKNENICIRNMDPSLQTQVTILIVDRKFSLVTEINDLTQKEISYAKSEGFATYSNSISTVLSYASIFESLWKQSALLKKLKESEELQKDFIHMAAHEVKESYTTNTRII